MMGTLYRAVFIVIITIMVWQETVLAVTFDDVKTDLLEIADNVSPIDGFDTLRPLTDSDLTLNVTLDWNLVSINDFDETNGYMDVSGFVTLEWSTDLYTTSQGVTDLLKPSMIWKPPIVLLNSVKTYELIGHDTSVKIRYNFTSKECEWKPWVVARAACSPDVKYYPFDKQLCTIRLSVWGYKTNEVSLSPKNNEWSFLYFEENGEWKIDETSVETTEINEYSVIDYKMKLTRRPLYYIINLISPVVLLGALSACTFLVPIESGERIGFSVTCFLTYVVLLNMIMGFLPTSGIPLSYLSYYTFVMMIFSAVMTVMTIFTIRIYHKSESDPVPVILSYIYRCFTCRSAIEKESKNVRDKVVPFDTASASWDNASIAEETFSQSNDRTSYSSVSTEVEDVTWKNIAKFIDTLLFVCFLGGQIFYSVAYLVPIFLN
ncbi:neuronal acetylcholine receptor subunit alpha-9-I-like [Ruditapes philippinarum]|uniref:neuronal acetylcholine receptor subunit alpha-9-I-like n=1 Tax=Ruditapes philippinarum TaxID=129788 RepID=UPI00295B71EA|nr:neuronal acetylcholine receptor subunit alpha-9-I-like [Ruditapes philippinarum]